MAKTFDSKIRSRAWLSRSVRRFQRAGRRVVFTNGCFDLLHVGHITLLQQAKRLGDVLIVAVNSDTSVNALKGPGRPITHQRGRARLVAALASVDYVTIFPEATPLNLIKALTPDVLVKGADWATDGIVGSHLVKQRGGRVARIPLLKGYSTTRLIARIGRLSQR